MKKATWSKRSYAELILKNNMQITIYISNTEGEELFTETLPSFEQAEEALGRAQRYINRQETKQLLVNDEF